MFNKSTPVCLNPRIGYDLNLPSIVIFDNSHTDTYRFGMTNTVKDNSDQTYSIYAKFKCLCRFSDGDYISLRCMADNQTTQDAIDNKQIICNFDKIIVFKPSEGLECNVGDIWVSKDAPKDINFKLKIVDHKLESYQKINRVC